MQTFNVKRKEFCYAGDWVSYLNLGTGILKQCYCGTVLQNIFQDPEAPIKWEAIGTNCPEPHCHNAHVWMTLGALPSVDTPTYTSMRDRVTDSDEHWLQPEMREFLGGKLSENNAEYDEKRRSLLTVKNILRLKYHINVGLLLKNDFIYCQQMHSLKYYVN